MQKSDLEFQDKLVRGLTHRMNNILSLFHGYVGLLIEVKNLAPEVREGLEKIRKGACAASELMDRTRALAQPSSIIWREVSLPDFILGIRTEGEALAGKSVRISSECPAELPKILTDSARLKMAVLELLKNAVEAAQESEDPKGGAVRISVSESDRVASEKAGGARPEKWIVIAVEDNGPGVPEALSERIFEPFFTTRNHNTSGLGLPVASGLAKQFDGLVDYESRPGRTVFRFSLPVRTER